MENRARYVVVGLFALLVIAAGFGFVYWLHNFGGLGAQAAYRVRFESTVSGLRAGSAVLFNGMRVGEVTELRLNPADPSQVMATIVIDQDTPVRADTYVGVEVQGLMGSPSISLRGRAGKSPGLAASGGELPVLVADPAAGQDAMQAARQVLQRIDSVLADNAEPLRDTIANLNTFSGALARNSDRLDTIVDGLVRMTGGGNKVSLPVYDLTAPQKFPPSEKAPHGQLVVPEPNALLATDTQKIAIRPAKDESPPALNGQWSENLPKLVQEKIIQSFENANYLSAVARPLDGLTADYQLLLDIRNFQISQSPEPTAEVEYGAKILGSNGKIVATRIFHATAPARSLDPAAAVAALDEAFGKTATELVIWTSGVVL